MGGKTKVSNIYGQVYGFAKEKITSLQQLYPGDHLAYEHVKLYWHHVIVEDIDSSAGEIKIIHYFNTVKGFFHTTLNHGSLAQVIRGSLKFLPNRFYRIVYDEGIVHRPEKVLELACARLGETNYSPLYENCEHFCTYCKTGESVSIQVECLVENLLESVLPPLTRVLLEELLKKTVQESIKQLSTGILKRAGDDILKTLSQTVFEIALIRCVSFVGSRTAWVTLQENILQVVKVILDIEARKLCSTGAQEAFKAAARNISGKGVSENSSPMKPRCRMTKSGVLASVAVELVFVGKDVRDAAVKKSSGEISKEEFEETVIKRVVGASVSTPMSLAGSVVGQYMIPVPAVGNVIGGIAGSAAGKVVGAVMSTTVIKARKQVGKLFKSFSWKR